MTATRRAADTLVILFALLVSWELLHKIAGETALPAPLPTLVYLMHNLTTPRFARQRWRPRVLNSATR